MRLKSLSTAIALASRKPRSIAFSSWSSASSGFSRYASEHARLYDPHPGRKLHELRLPALVCRKRGNRSDRRRLERGKTRHERLLVCGLLLAHRLVRLLRLEKLLLALLQSRLEILNLRAHLGDVAHPLCGARGLGPARPQLVGKLAYLALGLKSHFLGVLAERVVLLAHPRHARILRTLHKRAASHVLDVRASALQQQATAIEQLVCALLVTTAELVRIFLLRLDESGQFLGLGTHYGIYGRLYVCDFARRLREAAKLVLERMNLLAKLLAHGLLVFRRLLVLARDARRGGEHFLPRQEPP